MKLRQYKHAQIVERDMRRKFILRECMRSTEKRTDKWVFGKWYGHVFRSARKAWAYYWRRQQMDGIPF